LRIVNQKWDDEVAIHFYKQIKMDKSRAEIRRGVRSRIRKKVHGTAARPRLAIFRSLNHIYAQVIDDVAGKTLISASTVEADLRGNAGGNIEAAQRVGRAIAERLLATGVENVVFDRGGYVFHGRVRALTQAAREAGLNKGEADRDETTAPNEAGQTEEAESNISEEQ
jgi:large subunit ribosomal protein L18